MSSQCTCNPGSIQVCSHCARQDAYSQTRMTTNPKPPNGFEESFKAMFVDFKPQPKRS